MQLQQLPELGQVQGDNVALGLRGGGAAGTGGCCVVLSDLGVEFKERQKGGCWGWNEEGWAVELGFETRHR